MLQPLILYDKDGNVVGTVNHMVAKNEDGKVVGLIDFAAHELAGGRMRDICDAEQLDEPAPESVLRKHRPKDAAPDGPVHLPPDEPYRVAHDIVAGAAVWPEWIGPRAHDFRVELDPNPSPARARIKALVHKKSGHRRVRADIEAAIAERINERKQEAKKRGDEQRQRLKAKGMKKEMLERFADPPPEPADLRDLLGGPGRPLLLDENGKTRQRVKVARPNLPVVKRGSR